jgi:hypothetical protein
MRHDTTNQWFSILTDACCPIVSPKRFRYLFFQHQQESLLSWKSAWWNPQFQQRGNLAKLPQELWLAHVPWFVLSKHHVSKILHFVQVQQTITQTVCAGGLANESLFAIILKLCGELDNVRRVITHLTDWTRSSSATSPHVFKEANKEDIEYLERELERNQGVMFLRKVAPEFPDEVLRRFIYEYSKDKDDRLVVKEPFSFSFSSFLFRRKREDTLLLFLFLGVMTLVFWWMHL